MKSKITVLKEKFFREKKTVLTYLQQEVGDALKINAKKLKKTQQLLDEYQKKYHQLNERRKVLFKKVDQISAKKNN